MHIRLCLVLLLLAQTFHTDAQPVLTSYNISPIYGNEISYRSTGYFHQGDSGASKFWDFSALKSSSFYKTKVTECSKSPHCASFPGSNTTNRLLTDVTDYFYNSQPDSLVLTGLWRYRYAASCEYYPNGRTIFTFPFTYGSSFVDSFRTFLQQPGASMNYYGNDSVWADGWGSVKIGPTTISNVLRVKKITSAYGIELDSIKNTTSQYESKEIAYYWYVPYYHEYILYNSEVTNTFPNKTTYATYGGYTTSPEGPVTVNDQEKQPIRILQNPVHDWLRLELNENPKDDFNYRITDAQGKCVKQGIWSYRQGKTIELSLPDLTPGIYCLSITCSASSHSERFMLE